jgi:hypothetical protein
MLPRIARMHVRPVCNWAHPPRMQLLRLHTHPRMLVRLRMQLCALCLLMFASCLLMRMQVGTTHARFTCRACGDRYARGDCLCLVMLQHDALLQRTYEIGENICNILLQHMCIAFITNATSR